jgi:ABC-type polysaccharide/polyol phosphate export permease
MLARLLDFAISAALFIILAIIFRTPINLLGWLLIPVILLTQIFLVLGLGFLSAALNVFTRDIDPLLKLGIQVLFYATPVIYPISMVPENLRVIYYLNPMAGIIESYREILVYGRLPGDYLYFSMAIAVVMLFIGYLYFKKVEFQFADIV